MKKSKKKSSKSSFLSQPENWINRDLSLIAFNSRVLSQAEDVSLPLLERLKFLAIVSSNIDEFFMVRISLLKRLSKIGTVDMGPDQANINQLLDEINQEIRKIFTRQHQCWDESLFPSLQSAGISIVPQTDYTLEDKVYLEHYFNEQVLPVLTPMALDTSHPFPLLTSGAIYILIKAEATNEYNESFFYKADTVLVQVPIGLNRFITLPSKAGSYRFSLLDDIIMLFADKLIRGYNITGCYPFCVTRDAEITVDEEQVENLISAIEEELRRSRWGAPVRMIVHSSVPEEVINYLSSFLNLEDKDIYTAPGLINMKSLFNLLSLLNHPHLLDPPWVPQSHPSLRNNPDIFSVISKSDVILHHPYQSFDPVVKFIEQAADDPEVLAIKITLYRVSGQSPLVRALIRAAEKGKQVTALVELRARFDEEANISWARKLDAAGAHVIYGVVGYKTHSKAALVIRREREGIKRYCHLSTGNYNDRTARQYTDVGLFTCKPDFGSDISAFFNVITGYSLPPVWNRIEMAPTGLRSRTLAMIKREVDKHTVDNPGFIRAKMNALIDPTIIKELYLASQAGVKIDLLVRGMCRLRPGVPGLSESITVRSIVDRFLEHPRIFHYHNGGDEEIYLSSADWMERNMDRRLELLFPVIDPFCTSLVLSILDYGFSDNSNAWRLLSDSTYARITPVSSNESFRSQQRLYDLAVLSNEQLSEENKHEVFHTLSNPKH